MEPLYSSLNFMKENNQELNWVIREFKISVKKCFYLSIDWQKIAKTEGKEADILEKK